MSMKEKIAFPLMVEKIIHETPEAKSITLSIPDALKEKFKYRPGQFTSIFIEVEGQELLRSYSLSTDPSVDKEFRITVKKVPSGKASTFLLDELKSGQTLWCTPPTGQFFQYAEDKTHYLLIAAGSGITPLLSILKHVLATKPQSRVSLIYCNRSQKDIIFEQELLNLETRYSDRLKASYILSRPQPGWKGLSGRLDANSLSNIYTEILKRDRNPIVCYLCGPQPFMSMCREVLTTLGVSPDRIRSESFGSPTEVLSANSTAKSSIPADKDIQPQEGIQPDGSLIIGNGLSSPSEKPESLVAIIDGAEVIISARPNLSILESLLDEGHNPPYSCMSGACMACMATLEEGRVIQEDPGILSEDNIKNREILTCQAKPLSKKIKVRFHE